MTGATPPPQTSCLPCQLDPEAWFDRCNRADARADCLSCPARRWCAREALKCRASWGLWAGVWIGGRHEDAAPYLQSIAAGAVAQFCADEAARMDQRCGDLELSGDHDASASTPLCRPSGSSHSRSARTAILARSSGHCEVLAPGCRYTSERLLSRQLGESVAETASPPSLFAACAVCADMVAALDRKLAARFGYVIDAHRDPAHVAFYWRRSRWVLLDRDGWLTEMPDDARTA